LKRLREKECRSESIAVEHIQRGWRPRHCESAPAFKQTVARRPLLPQKLCAALDY
jgi:hypothetical protein